MTRHGISTLFALAVVGSASIEAQEANPLAKEQAAALADAKRIGPAVAARTRYLSMYNLLEAKRPEAIQVVTFWANALSTEADIARPRRVGPTLLAIIVDDYGPQWVTTWENLAKEDPFFHVQINQAINTTGRAYFPATADTKAGWYPAVFKEQKQVAAIAPWLPATDAAELVALTQSAAPIVRADWWFSRVAIQAGRKGTGYYDWFGLKKRDDFDRLVAFNRKESQRVKKEVAGIVARSGVSNFPRQVFRFQSVTGGYWETDDVLDDNVDARNALRQLDENFKPQAHEYFAVLANGLFVTYLANDAGVQQDTAPDQIGHDKTAPGNDGRIHAGVSCFRCHIEGIRPVNDWARRVFQGPLRLSSPDAEKARRLRQLYLGELNESRDEDVSRYAKILKRTNGLTPEANAKAIGRFWEAYVERDLLPADAAAELGMGEKVYLERLRAAFAQNPLADPVLASHIATPPVAIRADDWEQLFPLVAPTVLQSGGKGQ